MTSPPYQLYSDAEAGFWRFYADTRVLSCQHIDAAISLLTRVLEWHNSNKAVILSDQGVSACTWFKTIAENLSLPVYRIEPEPDQTSLTRLADSLHEQSCDLILAIGGGTVLDAAKLVGAAVGAEVPLDTLPETNSLATREVPVIAIPTTFGTGSETNMISHLSRTDSKLGLRRTWLAPAAAVLIAEIAVQTPWELRFLSAVDSWSHLLEALTLRREYSPLQTALLSQALFLQIRSLAGYLEEPNIDNATDIATASALAGLGLNNGRTALPHAMAGPFGLDQQLPHAASLLPFLGPVTRQLHIFAADRADTLGITQKLLDQTYSDAIEPGIASISDKWRLHIPAQRLELYTDKCMNDHVAIKESPLTVDRQSCLSIYELALTPWIAS